MRRIEIRIGSTPALVSPAISRPEFPGRDTPFARLNPLALSASAFEREARALSAPGIAINHHPRDDRINAGLELYVPLLYGG